MQLMPPKEFSEEHRRVGGQQIEALTFEAFVLHIQGEDGDLPGHFVRGGCSEAYADWLAANVRQSWAEVVRDNPVIVKTNEELAARASLAFAVALFAGALLVWVLLGSNTVGEWLLVGLFSVATLWSGVLAGMNVVQLVGRWISKASLRASAAMED